MDLVEKLCRYAMICDTHGRMKKGDEVQLGAYKYLCLSAFNNKRTSCDGLILKRMDREDKYIVTFKGSKELKDWFRDAWTWKMRWPYAKTKDMKRIRIHAGFKNQYSSVRNKVLREIGECIEAAKKAGKQAHITICGHSLGGALTSVCALDAYATFQDEAVWSVYTFASPRVYNSRGASIFEGHTDYAYRTVYAHDIVPQMPLLGYKHVGKGVHITQSFKISFEDFKRPFCLCNPLDHFLENYTEALRAIKAKGIELDVPDIPGDSST